MGSASSFKKKIPEAPDHFSVLADDLVDLLEQLDRKDLQGDARQVQQALQRAINAACVADRVRRKRREAGDADV